MLCCVVLCCVVLCCVVLCCVVLCCVHGVCMHSYLCVSLVHNDMCVSKNDTAYFRYTHVNHLLYPSHGLPVGVCLLECCSCTKRAHCSLMYMLLCPTHHQIGGEELLPPHIMFRRLSHW